MPKEIIELFLEGMSTEKAKSVIDREIANADPTICRLRLIHGFKNGTNIRDMVFDEYHPSVNPQIIRVEQGWNHGITELVLRDFPKSINEESREKELAKEKAHSAENA